MSEGERERTVKKRQQIKTTRVQRWTVNWPSSIPKNTTSFSRERERERERAFKHKHLNEMRGKKDKIVRVRERGKKQQKRLHFRQSV